MDSSASSRRRSRRAILVRDADATPPEPIFEPKSRPCMIPFRNQATSKRVQKCKSRRMGGGVRKTLTLPSPLWSGLSHAALFFIHCLYCIVLYCMADHFDNEGIPGKSLIRIELLLARTRDRLWRARASSVSCWRVSWIRSAGVISII